MFFVEEHLQVTKLENFVRSGKMRSVMHNFNEIFFLQVVSIVLKYDVR